MSTTNRKAYTFEMNLVSANILSIIIFLLFSVLTVSIFGFQNMFEHPFSLTILLSYFALHEVLHGIGFYLGGVKLSNIVYGILLEKGIFYCMAYQEVSKKNILISLQMPFMVIGVITYIISILFHLPFLAWLSVVNIMGASMDLVMFYIIWRIPDVTYSESGKPNEFVLISAQNLKKKSLFLRLKDVKDYKKEDYVFHGFKRFTITKSSFIVLIILILLDILSFCL